MSSRQPYSGGILQTFSSTCVAIALSDGRGMAMLTYFVMHMHVEKETLHMPIPNLMNCLPQRSAQEHICLHGSVRRGPSYRRSACLCVIGFAGVWPPATVVATAVRIRLACLHASNSGPFHHAALSLLWRPLQGTQEACNRHRNDDDEPEWKRIQWAAPRWRLGRTQSQIMPICLQV